RAAVSHAWSPMTMAWSRPPAKPSTPAMLNSAAGLSPWTRVEVIATVPDGGVAGTRPRLATATRYDLRSARAFAASSRPGTDPDAAGRSVGVSSSSEESGEGDGSGVAINREGRGVVVAIMRSQ